MSQSIVRTDRHVAASSRISWEVVDRSQGHDLQLKKYDPLFRQGSPSSHFYLLCEGVMCNHLLFTDGRRQVISFSYPGEAIGLTETDSHRLSCDAVCDARLRCIPKSTFRGYVESHAEVGLRLLEFASAEIANARDHEVLLGRKTAMEKVSSFLLLLAQKQGDQIVPGTEIYVPMSRTDIADYLGLTIETVCRNLTKLKAKSIVEIPHSTKIIVWDVHRLEDLGQSEDVTPECWR